MEISVFWFNYLFLSSQMHMQHTQATTHMHVCVLACMSKNNLKKKKALSKSQEHAGNLTLCVT